MNLKKIISLVLALTTSAALTAQTYVVLVNPEGSKEWGYIKTDGQYLIEPKFRKAAPFASNGLAVAQNPKSKEYQFINTNGEWLQTEVTDFKLKSTFGFGLKGFSEGLAPIGKDKKWGYLGGVPFSASTAAHWLMLQGLDVDCDWILRIAPISFSGPAAYPMRQPVMA